MSAWLALAVGCADDSAERGAPGDGGAPPSSTTVTVVGVTTGSGGGPTSGPGGGAHAGGGGQGAGSGGAADAGGGGAGTGGQASTGQGGFLDDEPRHVCGDGSVCQRPWVDPVGPGPLCSFDPTSETWSCVAAADCQPERQCGGECCPTGSRCASGACRYPDLQIDRDRLLASLVIDHDTFGVQACELAEGCIDAPGRRRLLRFDLKTPNAGSADLFLGDPEDNADLFEYSACHDHYHFTTYAAYRLLDQDGRVTAAGHKQAFCLLDFERQPSGAQNAVYSCSYQGIQDGWADIYDSYLPCQWIDVTDVPAGDYQLEVVLNAAHVIVEDDYDNDVATVPVTLRDNTCRLGCAPWDADVCRAGDPLGHADDGHCDCAGLFEWDAADCLACDGCPVSSCPGGCAAPEPECCGAADACGLALNGVCDCGGGARWDAADCSACVSADADCPAVDSCPHGCGFRGGACNGVDADSLLDGYCDCAAQGWDRVDCFSCSSDCGQD